MSMLLIAALLALSACTAVQPAAQQPGAAPAEGSGKLAQ
ncbi:MAG: amino acid ABC transporter substrate-binding protein, partial [Candidatus Thermofonsia Clade 3 bacterium]